MIRQTELWPTADPSAVRRVTLHQRTDGTWWTGIVHPGHPVAAMSEEDWPDEAAATSIYEWAVDRIWRRGPGHPGPWHRTTSDLPITADPPLRGWTR
ncbi:hypothetical protein [Actinoalloteichus sp. GBA129-24]|uniref:hypothetical protein n=1 Tax=Actinoalloteichus sp. GBA129-24 TaxID=1612551 RepID=UPI0009506FDB|nr:hypothetical protein [Actinoalloteichus sp. GBA129-24]APU20980.1 hypothetical protein UA75_14850 [Actinoalloteichus sp. GBA129-24]APU24229.1 hypothetical protein UA75_31330 [Actinoalloteichus sp. GBA129-24]